VTADPVTQAERLGRTRIALFYALAAAFVASTMLQLYDPERASRLVGWLVLAALVAANLTPFGGWLRPGAVTRLLNDETTRAHRQASLVAGCWAAVLAGMALVVSGGALALDASQAARLIVMACLTTGLVCFATLELRATNG
jgi:hypothetical protein